jgi:hypothetical protein
MHRTTTTELSDAMDNLQQLHERLQDSTWMPEEERFATVCAGAMVCNAIQENNIGLFTDEEIEFVNKTATMCDDIARELTGPENDQF